MTRIGVGFEQVCNVMELCVMHQARSGSLFIDVCAQGYWALTDSAFWCNHGDLSLALGRCLRG